MTPAKLLSDALASLLAADATTLAPAADNNIVSLVISPFTPDPGLDITTLMLATFTGSAPKLAGLGTQTVFRDPISGLRVIQIKEPIGGWNWVCTVTPGAPETVYGVLLTDEAGTVYLGSELLESPTTIALAGDGVTVGSLWFSFMPNNPF